MDTPNGFHATLATTRQLANRLLVIGENRLELLAVEMQEARERLLHLLLLAIGVAVFGLLAGMGGTAAIVVLLWTVSPLGVLLTLTALYAAIGILLWRRLATGLREWQVHASTLTQLRKDRACLSQFLA